MDSGLSFTLAVHDLDQTEHFYADILQMPVERLIPSAGHPPVLLLRQGGTAVLFREIPVLEALHPALFQNLERHPLGVGVSLDFSVSNLAALRRTIDRRKMHILYELEDRQFDRAELWLHDPDGYLVVLNQERITG